MKEEQTKIYDFVGVGIGPFNLGLACLTEPIEGVEALFLDKKDQFNWHPGMLLENTTLQIPFLADLVSMADPTSKFSFLKYLKDAGRMYPFYIRENFLMLRNEYNMYCKWAIEQLKNLEFNTRVEHIDYDENNRVYNVSLLNTKTGNVKRIRTRKLVLGTGTVPYIPTCCKELVGKAIHSASYLNHKKKLQTKKSITIVGSGQSAAEIFYDLLQEIEVYGYTLNWITRSPRFFPLEYSKLTLEMTSPEYVDYYYNLPQAKKDKLIKEQNQLYKGINDDLIANIYDTIYTKKLLHEHVEINLRTNSSVQEASCDDQLQQFELDVHQVEQDKYYKHKTEALVLATGYQYQLPAFIEGIRHRISWDEKGRYQVGRNYSIDKEGEEIFVQNAELHTHGFVTPDLGMASYRNSYLIKEMTGVEHYPIEKKIAFQQFEVFEEEEIKQLHHQEIV